MTSQAAQEKPTSPRTEAGRTLVQRMLSSKTEDRMGPDDLQRAILAIEREAAAATPSLDVDRLANAIAACVDQNRRQWRQTFDIIWTNGTDVLPSEAADLIAAEYARLDEGSATPHDPIDGLLPWDHPYESLEDSMACKHCGWVGSYAHTAEFYRKWVFPALSATPDRGKGEPR